MNSHAIMILCAAGMAASSIIGYTPEHTPNNLAPQDYRVDVDRQEVVPTSVPLEIPVILDSNVAEYDFIVVGSGSAGSVIANRLSEIGSWKILLLEAGNPENNVALYPTLADILAFTEYDWGYTAEPQENFCLAMNKQRCFWPRGRGLGGTTIINTMIYSRGHPKDYNRWAALGNPGWSYAEVLPYFLKSENARLNVSNPAFHHTGGYQSVESPYVTEYAKVFIEAGQQLGYRCVDQNSPDEIGFSAPQTTTLSGRRHTVASAFLTPVLYRRNLQVVTGARVTKILIDPTTKEAYGVQYVRSDRPLVAKARKEVIVSAGVIGSPQLLMLSGIGPQQHLQELGIKTLSNLAVGQTLYDQIRYVGLVLNANQVPTSPSVLDPEVLEQWQTTGGGPLASVGIDGLAFLNTGVTGIDRDVPDAELMYLPARSMPSDGGALIRRVAAISDDYYNLMFAPLESQTTFTILPIILHPKSKGCIKLRSADPFEHPLIYANYLTDPEQVDARALIAVIRFTLRLIETPAFQRYNATLNPTPVVGCENLPFNSDEYWYCAIQFLSATDDHQTSTCKMGPSDDPTAVVDNELRVYGIRNLRVADASIIPITLSGHTNAPSMMVGEVASDLIKKHWRASHHRDLEPICTIDDNIFTNHPSKCGLRPKLQKELRKAHDYQNVPQLLHDTFIN